MELSARLALVPNQVVDGVRAPIVRLLVLQATVETREPSCPMLVPA
jgi:hypothetical protein